MFLSLLTHAISLYSEDLANLLRENADIKAALLNHQASVSDQIKQHMGASDNHAEVLHATQSENTQLLLKELQSLRASGEMQFTSVPYTSLPPRHASSHAPSHPTVEVDTPRAVGDAGRPPSSSSPGIQGVVNTPLPGNRERRESDPRVSVGHYSASFSFCASADNYLLIRSAF